MGKQNLLESFRKHPFLYSIFFSISFIILSSFLTPDDLYPDSGEDISRIIGFTGTEIVSHPNILIRAAEGWFPWVILSPQAIIPVCYGFGCEYLLFVYVAYFIGIYFITYSLLRKNTLKYLLIACLIFGSYGLFYTYKTFIKPPLKLNERLYQLQELSGKDPFPVGTSMSEASYDVNKGVDGREFTVFDLNYKSTINSNNNTVASIWFYSSPQNRAPCSYGGMGQVEFEVAPDIWRCKGIWRAEDFTYYAVLEEGKLFIKTSRSGIATSSNEVPDFIKYYTR